MSGPVLLFVILIEGFITISAEILTIRQLLPFVGNSVVVTSLIIGVFLLFLAYGYRKGGTYQKDYIPILKKNFIASAFCLGIGLSFAFIQFFFNSFDRYISHEVLIALAAYLLLITAPLVYILGQTVPITMNLIKTAKSTGEVGGKILHLSTVGSFLGAVLTSLLLMNYLGVAWTVFINFCLLTILTLVLFSKGTRDFIGLVILATGLCGVYIINIKMEKVVFVKTNAYANYVVYNDDQNVKRLQVNNSLSSLLTNDNRGFPYIEFIKRILFDELQLSGKDILVLGAGGFTLSAENTYGNHFTYIDIDKDIEEVVKKHFLKNIKGEFIDSDARSYLSSAEKKFDVIVSDVYSNRRTIPAHLITQEYFLEVKQVLNAGGLAVFNIIARHDLNDPYSARIDNTLRSVFKACTASPVNFSNEFSNIIYVCKDTVIPSSDRDGIYRDDLNRSTLDFFNSKLNS